MKFIAAIRILQAGVFSLWASSAHATVCSFDDFEFEVRRVGAALQVTDAGGSRAFLPVLEEPGFWFALGFSDHGKEAEFLSVHGLRVILTVHSIGQLLVSETFHGVCAEPIGQ